MRIIRLGHWQFTEPELEWLAEQAAHNELAANILVRFNHHYGRRESILRHLASRLH